MKEKKKKATNKQKMKNKKMKEKKKITTNKQKKKPKKIGGI